MLSINSSGLQGLLMYVACYPYDPDLHYTHMMYPPVGEPSFCHHAWQISSSLRNKIKKWSQYIWALYQAWRWYVHQIWCRQDNSSQYKPPRESGLETQHVP